MLSTVKRWSLIRLPASVLMCEFAWPSGNVKKEKIKLEWKIFQSVKRNTEVDCKHQKLYMRGKAAYAGVNGKKNE